MSIDLTKLMENDFGVVEKRHSDDGGIKVGFNDLGNGEVTYWVNPDGSVAKELPSSFTVRNVKNVENKAFDVASGWRDRNIQLLSDTGLESLIICLKEANLLAEEK